MSAEGEGIESTGLRAQPHDRKMVDAIMRQRTRMEGGTPEEIAERRASAEIAVGELERAILKGEKLDDAFVERAAAAVHEAWLERNKGKVNSPEHGEGGPYEAMSEEWKEKDRVYPRAAIELHRKGGY